MESSDDDLENFAAHGAAPLPATGDQGYVDHDGARLWYATYGSGPAVILLHGGLGHSTWKEPPSWAGATARASP